MPSKEYCDVLAELHLLRADQRKKAREFFHKLDSQHLLFVDYVNAVKVHFKCTADQAGKLICSNLNGDFND